MDGKNEPAPFMDELGKYSKGKNEIVVRKGDMKFLNQDTDITISRIYVDPGHRQNEIGNSMLEDIKRLAKEYGYKKIWLKASFSTTFLGNAMSFEELKKWYLRNDFKICEDRGYEVYMHCDL